MSTSSFGVFDRAPIDALEEAGFEVTLNPHGRKLSEDEAVALYANCIGVVAGTEKVNETVLAASPHLKAISRVGVGTDAIDFDAAKNHGVAVVNTPSAHVDAVAELCLAGMLSMLRHVPQADRIVRGGQWKKPMGRLLRGKTVGLIGFGQVAQRLCELLAPFEVKVIATDLAPDAERAAHFGVELGSMEDVLCAADLVSLHVPATPKTMGLIGAKELEQMKPDAIILNAARGGIVDESALVTHLDSEPKFSAFLDTFAAEPYSGPLAQHDRVVVTSHIGSYAVESRIQMESEAAENLIRLLRDHEDAQ